MDGFYAYIIGPDGHVNNRIDLRFEKQKDAIERAKALVDSYDVELWQRDRKIATRHARDAGRLAGEGQAMEMGRASHRGRSRSGYASTFEQARAGFETA
ncbi:hypothetical protein [Bradyrhizobium sp. OAE829]|uniref:hypothetical protein n=1 Tax=Bradyrhizobium sp. OAE829 TaxID=2663807 RepID=UPI00178A26CD